MAYFVEQWEELIDNKWVLSIISNGFKIPFKSVPPLLVVRIYLSQSSSSLLQEEITQLLKNWAMERVRNPVFFPQLFLMPKEELKVMPSNGSFLTKLVYKKTAFQDGDSQVSKTIDNDQQLSCLHRSDGCISLCSDTSEIQKIPSVRLRTSGLSVHGLNIRNVPKSMDFHKMNECNSNTLTTTCRISLPIPR